MRFHRGRLPAGFSYTGQQAFVGQFTESHTRETEFAVVPTRTTSQEAAYDYPARRSVAGKFRQFQTSRCTIVISVIRIVSFVTEFGPIAAILFRQCSTAVIFIDRTQFS